MAGGWFPLVDHYVWDRREFCIHYGSQDTTAVRKIQSKAKG